MRGVFERINGGFAGYPRLVTARKKKKLLDTKFCLKLGGEMVSVWKR